MFCTEIVNESKLKPNKLWVDQAIMAYNSLSYLYYLDKLVDEYNNTYHRSIGKKPIDADYTALTKEIETVTKAPKLKLAIESELLTKKQELHQKLVKRYICYWFHVENWLIYGQIKITILIEKQKDKKKK